MTDAPEPIALGRLPFVEGTAGDRLLEEARRVELAVVLGGAKVLAAPALYRAVVVDEFDAVVAELANADW